MRRRGVGTARGPADYALCDNGSVLGVVEAKKLTLGPEGVLTQAARYSRGLPTTTEFELPDGHKVPFLYSTNGELVMFHDVRNELNRSREVSCSHAIDALRDARPRSPMGALSSFWIDPATGTSPAPKPAYLLVRQTASTVSAILLTDESRSVSSLATVNSGDGVASFDYLYLNRPDSKFEGRSRMHHGSTSLDITGRFPTRLKGRYWTDRDSRGELDFIERRQHAAEDFEEAARLFGEGSKA